MGSGSISVHLHGTAAAHKKDAVAFGIKEGAYRFQCRRCDDGAATLGGKDGIIFYKRPSPRKCMSLQARQFVLGLHLFLVERSAMVRLPY
jgi:hypothetical protein